MDAGGPVAELCEEATCPICLEFFQDPVTIAECGHNFCRACLARSWGESPAEASCPQCRGTAQPGDLRPNRQLANVVEIVKRMSLPGGNRRATERVCKKHRECLNLFCQDDETLLCVACGRSKEHKEHEVMLAVDAAEEYKDKFCSCLETLKKTRERILEYKADVEKESRELLEQTGTERQEMVAECRQLRQFLEERERLLLAQMEEVEEEIARERDERLERLSRKLFCLECLIREMEEKIQQPPSELLQDVRSILQRCEEKAKSKKPPAFPRALKWRIWDISDHNILLKAVTNQFKAALVSGLQLHKANVSLDPDTAHPYLALSGDWKSLQWGWAPQDLPNSPERVDFWPAVLGREEFAGGRHFWEVTVGSAGDWFVGITGKSVKKKGRNTPFSVNNGFWSIGKAGKFYQTSNDDFPLSVSSEPKRIRVSLNYAGRQVAFFDADKAAILFVFSDTYFGREALQPFFAVFKKGYLRLPL
ncbi:E3 ubiquitin-protein ligase TRIM7-like [Eublepharis macularius]|uniref:E3 ubiquitin-protein ligase TRIM7-like n=1 Tax=Eublepharis macularius TaxID=481883 RepID=A0AA97J6M4_EUBMA|nr:E3 ubiquitin-protein ligase TRIM7-like [Eublepharis macularius]